MRRVTLVLAFLLASSTAFAADDPGGDGGDAEEAPPTSITIAESAPDAPRNFGNFRAGAGSTTENGHAYLCLEGSPLAFFALEACGTGSGFLHDDESPETAHFRTKLSPRIWKFREGFFAPHLDLGFAELQVAEDNPGFDFRGTGPDGVETAGPEVGAGVRLLYPLSRYVEVVGDLSVAYAYLPHAPDLVKPHDANQLSATFSFGVGF